LLPMLYDVLLFWLQAFGTVLLIYFSFAAVTWVFTRVILPRSFNIRKIRGGPTPREQVLKEIVFSLRTMAVFATATLLLALLNKYSLLYGVALAERWGRLWFWTCLVLMIVAHDAYFYWTHRLVHDPRLFRRMHRRHHRSHAPSPFTAYSFDLGEAAMLAGFVVIWVIVVPTPAILAPIFMLHQIFRNTTLHSGYEIMPAGRDGRPLLGWLTSVTHHDLHHAEGRWNYGLYFTWWDSWMKTEHPEYLERFATARGGRTDAPRPAADSSSPSLR